MQEGRPSKTAMMVAFYRTLGDRGVTSVPGFSDPAAHKLLEGRFWRHLLAGVEGLERRGKAKGHGQRGFAPWVDGMIVRVAFIDAEIAEAKPRQVVILGAGLDTRAWRLEALRGVRVFEVDHPSTQAYKREHAAALGPPIADVTYVTVDFVSDDLGARLNAAGYDATLPTVWIWEGVVMYLDDAALRRTLASIRALLGPESRLVVHYHEPEPNKRSGALRDLLFGWLGEPHIGLRTASTMAAELGRAGFRVEKDAGIDDQAARVGTTMMKNGPLRVSRILVAR